MKNSTLQLRKYIYASLNKLIFLLQFLQLGLECPYPFDYANLWKRTSWTFNWKGTYSMHKFLRAIFAAFLIYFINSLIVQRS